MQIKSSLKTPAIALSVCISMSCAARTFTWTGADGDGRWSTSGNWLKDGATANRLPQSGDSVVLADTAVGTSGNTIDIDVDTSFDTLTFKGTQSYTLSSAADKAIMTSGSWYVGAETESASLTVSLKCTSGGRLYVGCDENLPSVLNVTDGAEGGLAKTGQGILTLGAPWQFTGALTVEEGTVVDSTGKTYGDPIPVAIHERRVLAIGGVRRSYALYVPKNVKENPALVFSLHGAYGTIYTFYKDVNGEKTKVEQENSEDDGVYFEPNDRSPFRLATADEAGCIVVYPQGLKRNLLGMKIPGWLADGESAEDIDFFKAIIEDVAAHYQIDRKRIYCCGFSNGGMMTYAATTLASDTFAAFASISGYPLNEFHFRATGARPVPFLHIHGKSDDFVRYALWPTVRDMMVARNGCVCVPTVTTDEGRYTKSVYAAGEGGFQNVTYECDGMGHSDYTSRTDEGNSSKTMWNFMSQYALDDACDKTLKLRMDSTSPERGWSETTAGSGTKLSYGTDAGANNVYHSIQLEKGTYTLALKTRGIANDRYFVKLSDASDASKVLLCRSAKIGHDAKFAITVDRYRQCKLVIVKEKPTDEITEIAIHSGSPGSLAGAIDCTIRKFVEIPQIREGNDTPVGTTQTGDGYIGYTANGAIQVAYKMKNIEVADCEYVLIKFADPVLDSGWGLAIEGIDGYIRIPEGSSGYRIDFDASVLETGVFPKLALVALGPDMPLTASIEGIYGHSLVNGFKIRLC